jgi:hypothetical protein
MTDLITHHPRHAGDRALDSYRTGLRRLAMRDSRTLRAVRAGVLTLAGVLGLVFLAATAPTPASRGVASMAQTEAPQTW